MNLGKAIHERLWGMRKATTASAALENVPNFVVAGPKVIAIYLGWDDFARTMACEANHGCLQVQSDGWRYKGIRMYQVDTKNHFEIGVKFE